MEKRMSMKGKKVTSKRNVAKKINQGKGSRLQKGVFSQFRTGEDVLERQEARRIYYDNTTIDQRIKDEQTTEEPATTLLEYENNVLFRDVPGIDDKIPDGFWIRTYFPTKTEIDGKLRKLWEDNEYNNYAKSINLPIAVTEETKLDPFKFWRNNYPDHYYWLIAQKFKEERPYLFPENDRKDWGRIEELQEELENDYLNDVFKYSSNEVAYRAFGLQYWQEIEKLMGVGRTFNRSISVTFATIRNIVLRELFDANIKPTLDSRWANILNDPLEYEKIEDQYGDLVANTGSIMLYDGNNQNYYVGKLLFEYTPKTNHIHVIEGKLDKNYRGRGLYPYIRRELMNIADEKKLTISTRALPYELSNSSAFDKIAVKSRTEELEKHYASFSKPDKIIVDKESDEDVEDVVYIHRQPNE